MSFTIVKDDLRHRRSSSTISRGGGGSSEWWWWSRIMWGYDARGRHQYNGYINTL